MEVGLFDKMVESNRSQFRYILDNNIKDVRTTASVERIKFKDWIMTECFGICTSEFEEQTMMENLKEEFEEFIKELKGE